jgi:hypothetical protein
MVVIGADRRRGYGHLAKRERVEWRRVEWRRVERRRVRRRQHVAVRRNIFGE